MEKKYDILPAIFLIFLSIFVILGSYKLELGNFQNPGPGLMPFLLGVGLFLVSIFIAGRSFSKIQKRQDVAKQVAPSKVNFNKIVLVSGSLVTYALFLEKLGFLFSTLLLLIFLFKIAGSGKWRSVLAASVLTVIATYLVFTYLGIRFPKGIIGF